MKTFTSTLILAMIVASVTVPGLMAAGVALPFSPALALFVVVAGISGVLLTLAQSVERVRTGSTPATNRYGSPCSRGPLSVRTNRTRGPVRRVRAIIEFAS